MGVRTIDIHCPKCDQHGAHLPSCANLSRFPVVCIIQDDGHIESFLLHNGLDFANKAPKTSKMTVHTTEIRGFAVGRALLSVNGTHVWQTYPDAFEKTLFQGPQQTSTDATHVERPSPGAFSNLSSIRATPTHPWPFLGMGQVPGGPDVDLDASIATHARMMTSSLSLSNASANLVDSIPQFDGNHRNYREWIRKVKGARKYQDDSIFVDQIKQKLGAEATEYIAGQGSDITTVDALLECLDQQYDLFADPSYAYNAFINLVQDGRELAEYHSDFANLLPAVEANLQSTNPFISTNYIRGLDDLLLRENLNMLIATNRANDKPTTVKMLIDRSTLRNRVKSISKHKTEEPEKGGPAAVRIANARVSEQSTNTGQESSTPQAPPDNTPQVIEQVQHAAPRYQNNPPSFNNKPPRYQNQQAPKFKPQQPFRFNSNSGGGQHDRYCPIHKVGSHGLAQCKIRDATQCPYCNIDLQPGTLASHVPGCTGRRCNNCGRLGHTDPWCKYDRSGNYVGVPQQFQTTALPRQRANVVQGQGRGGGDADSARPHPQRQGGHHSAPRSQQVQQRVQSTANNQQQYQNRGDQVNRPARSRSPINRPRSPPQHARGQGNQHHAQQANGRGRDETRRRN